MPNTSEGLPFLSSQERLTAYQLIVDGCSHIWSKNVIQEDRAKQALQTLIPLTKNDPYFLAHLTSYVMRKSKSKDLQVFLAYVSSLSSADGTPFSPGSSYVKPNLRYIGASAVQMLDPKLVDRVVKVANTKYAVPGYLNDASHFPMTLRTAIKKYIKYREAHPEYVEGIKKAALGRVLKRLYVAMRLKPSEEVVKILRWKRKDMPIDFGERLFDFEDLTDLQIAKIIRNEQLSYLGVIGELYRIGKKISPVIAVALLESATGNQAVIMRATFEDAGILKDPEVMELYKKKIREAKTTLDRAHTVSETASQAVKQALAEARAETRQKETAGIGKIYVHIDDSGSMRTARDFAIDRGAILAECVNNPRENFRWGIFGSTGQEVPLPREFVKDAFAAELFPFRQGGSTNCFALYNKARAFGADTDIFISDGEHTDGNLETKIRKYHEEHPEVAKPKACVVVWFGSWQNLIKDAYEANGIPVSVIKPDTLTQSALVVEAVKSAILGPVAIIDSIMEEPLLELPSWYYAL